MYARNYWPHELRGLICRAGFVIRTTGFVWPLFEQYRWLPSSVIRRYRKLIPVIERLPIIRRFGLSQLIVAQKP